MNYSRQYLTELAASTNFIKDNLEKVLRLAEILKFINNDSILRGKLALKGGTAINLTVVELPRLSVDIDLDFTENLSKEKTAEARQQITKRLTDYMWQEGYSLLAELREHYALSSYVFNYINNAGNRDNIKIEINFMDRCHILPLEYRSVNSKGVTEQFDVLTLHTTELYASKINALLSRAVPRDLYDVYYMIGQNIVTDTEMLRKCLVFYNMVGGDQDIVEIDFKNLERITYQKVKRELKPVIAKTDKFDLETAKKVVLEYLAKLVVLTDSEKRFVAEFKNKNYLPELLFDNNTADKLHSHPMALWRCRLM